MEEHNAKGKVLFYCRCNSLWSQMAEAFLETLFPERFEAYSAGASVSTVHPDVVRVMAEVGIDLTGRRSKAVEEFIGTKFDCVALVCGDPPEVCPLFPQEEKQPKCSRCASCCIFMPFFPRGARLLRASFKDPTRAGASADQALELFRQVRNDIRDWILDAFGAADIRLTSGPGGRSLRPPV